MSERVSIPMRSFLTAVAIAFLALIPLYKACVWAFIKYWESQRGVRMMFIFWAEGRAFPTALLISGLVFIAVFQLLQRGNEKRIATWKLATATLASVVLLSLGLVSCLWLRLL